MTARAVLTAAVLAACCSAPARPVTADQVLRRWFAEPFGVWPAESEPAVAGPRARQVVEKLTGATAEVEIAPSGQVVRTPWLCQGDIEKRWTTIVSTVKDATLVAVKVERRPATGQAPARRIGEGEIEAAIAREVSPKLYAEFSSHLPRPHRCGTMALKRERATMFALEASCAAVLVSAFAWWWWRRNQRRN